MYVYVHILGASTTASSVATSSSTTTINPVTATTTPTVMTTSGSCSQSKKIVCYFPNWAYGRPGTERKY